MERLGGARALYFCVLTPSHGLLGLYTGHIYDYAIIIFMVKLTPASGIILVEMPKDDTSKIITSQTPKGRLLCGTVVGVGASHITDHGVEIKIPCKVGQTVWFLSYEGNYDVARVDDRDIYFVLVRDIRGYI